MQILFLLCVTLEINASELELPSFSRKGPTCGVRCLYIAARANGVELDYGNLLKKEYVGNDLGSDISELALAARDAGLHSYEASNLTIADLKNLECPVILHMRSSGAKTEFDHWITFLGFQDKQVNIYDPSHGYEKIKPAELLSNWSGVGLVVSPKETKVSTQSGYLRIVFLLVFCSISLVLSKKFVESKPSGSSNVDERSKILQSTVLGFLICAFAFSFHYFSDIGFLQNRYALAEVARRYNSLEFDVIEKNELQSLIVSNDTVVIDTRFASDYRHSTIPGSINLAVNSSLAERKETLDGVSRESKIVVFCQSNECNFSDEIAQFLKFNGYHDVLIYRNGFVDWLEN